MKEKRTAITTTLELLADKSNKQIDIARDYRRLILIDRCDHDVDWKKVNKAIVTRWSKSGLNRVKGMTWKIT